MAQMLKMYSLSSRLIVKASGNPPGFLLTGSSGKASFTTVLCVENIPL